MERVIKNKLIHHKTISILIWDREEINTNQNKKKKYALVRRPIRKVQKNKLKSGVEIIPIDSVYSKFYNSNIQYINKDTC